MSAGGWSCGLRAEDGPTTHQYYSSAAAAAAEQNYYDRQVTIESGAYLAAEPVMQRSQYFLDGSGGGRSGYGGVEQAGELARLAAEAEAAMQAALAAEAVGGLPDGVELLGGPHAEVEYFLAVVLATRAAEYRSECAARAMRQRDPREAEAARAYPAAEAEAEAARALKAGYEAARLGGRSIRIGTISNPARTGPPLSASLVTYPNSWFLPRESDDEMVARDPRWRQKNYTYDAEGKRAVVKALREVDWREEQPLLNCWSDFKRPEEYGLAYRAAYARARARAAAEKEAAEVLPLAEAVVPLRFLEEVLAQRSQRAAAEEREAQARYEVLLAKAEAARKQLQVALEAAQAEAAPELREESRVLAVMPRVFRMEGKVVDENKVCYVDLREAESAAKAKEAEATKAEAAVLAPTRRRLAAALHTGQTISLIMKKGLIAISNSATISSEGLIVQLLGVLIADVLIMDPHNAHLAISRFMPHASRRAPA